MVTDETPRDDAPETGTDSSHGRRRFVQLSGSAIALGLAGCADLGLGEADGDDDDGVDDDRVGSTPANRENQTDTPTETDVEETDEETDEEATATGTGEDVHDHGSLYLEIDGERHPFTDPKYYQPGEHPDAGASDRFHFHDDGDDNRWHMHGERLTLEAALGVLPDVDYESADGAHVVHFEGDTYEDGRGGTTIEIRWEDERIDPLAYELQDGDEIWIEIATGDDSN